MGDLGAGFTESWTNDTDNMHVGAGREIAVLSGIENVVGTPMYDVLIGDAGNNVLSFIGGPGRDIMDGAGDVLDLHDVLGTFSGYDGTNAFSDGYVQLVRGGPDTLVCLDVDGTHGTALPKLFLTLVDMLLSESDTANYVV